LDHCTEFLEQCKHLRKAPLQQKDWITLLRSQTGFSFLRATGYFNFGTLFKCLRVASTYDVTCSE